MKSKISLVFSNEIEKIKNSADMAYVIDTEELLIKSPVGKMVSYTSKEKLDKIPVYDTVTMNDVDNSASKPMLVNGALLNDIKSLIPVIEDPYKYSMDLVKGVESRTTIDGMVKFIVEGNSVETVQLVDDPNFKKDLSLVPTSDPLSIKMSSDVVVANKWSKMEVEFNAPDKYITIPFSNVIPSTGVSANLVYYNISINSNDSLLPNSFRLGISQDVTNIDIDKLVDTVDISNMGKGFIYSGMYAQGSSPYPGGITLISKDTSAVFIVDYVYAIAVDEILMRPSMGKPSQYSNLYNKKFEELDGDQFKDQLDLWFNNRLEYRSVMGERPVFSVTSRSENIMPPFEMGHIAVDGTEIIRLGNGDTSFRSCEYIRIKKDRTLPYKIISEKIDSSVGGNFQFGIIYYDKYRRPIGLGNTYMLNEFNVIDDAEYMRFMIDLEYIAGIDDINELEIGLYQKPHSGNQAWEDIMFNGYEPNMMNTLYVRLPNIMEHMPEDDKYGMELMSIVKPDGSILRETLEYNPINHTISLNKYNSGTGDLSSLKYKASGDKLYIYKDGDIFLDNMSVVSGTSDDGSITIPAFDDIIRVDYSESNFDNGTDESIVEIDISREYLSASASPHFSNSNRSMIESHIFRRIYEQSGAITGANGKYNVLYVPSFSGVSKIKIAIINSDEVSNDSRYSKNLENINKLDVTRPSTVREVIDVLNKKIESLEKFMFKMNEGKFKELEWDISPAGDVEWYAVEKYGAEDIEQ